MAYINDYIPQNSVGSNCLPMQEIPASGTKVFIYVLMFSNVANDEVTTLRVWTRKRFRLFFQNFPQNLSSVPVFVLVFRFVAILVYGCFVCFWSFMFRIGAVCDCLCLCFNWKGNTMYGYLCVYIYLCVCISVCLLLSKINKSLASIQNWAMVWYKLRVMSVFESQARRL